MPTWKSATNRDPRTACVAALTATPLQSSDEDWFALATARATHLLGARSRWPRHPRAALQFPAGLTIRASSLDSTAQLDDATFVESHDLLQSPTPAAGAGSTGSVVRVSARLGWPHNQPGGAVDLFDARLIRSEHDGACRSQGCGNLYCCSCIGCSTALVAGSSCMMPSGPVHHTTDCGVSHEICRSAVQLPARRLRRSG